MQCIVFFFPGPTLQTPPHLQQAEGQLGQEREPVLLEQTSCHPRVHSVPEAPPIEAKLDHGQNNLRILPFHVRIMVRVSRYHIYDI